MKTDHPVLANARKGSGEWIRIRRWLHAHPELGFEEKETSSYIRDYLTGLGIPVQSGVAETGVVGLLKGDLPGGVVLLRADMDALPVAEETGLDFASVHEGKMHACGHDAHMTILLAAAALLAGRRSELRGSVKFVFQPAEEGVRGAKQMIQEGVLEDPAPDAALALHIAPDVPAGTVAVKDGSVTACADEFRLTILGRGGHSSSPHTTIDPVVTGAQLIMALQTIVSRNISPLEPAVVSICQFSAGTAANVIPSTASLSGKTRSYNAEIRERILSQIDTIARGICQAAGADYKLEIFRQVPVTHNDSALTRDFIRCSSQILSEAEIAIMTAPQTFSEDFSLFAEKVPAVLFFLGTRNPEKDCVYPLHNPKFQIDEDVLPLGASLLANYCLNRERARRID